MAGFEALLAVALRGVAGSGDASSSFVVGFDEGIVPCSGGVLAEGRGIGQRPERIYIALAACCLAVGKLRCLDQHDRAGGDCRMLNDCARACRRLEVSGVRRCLCYVTCRDECWRKMQSCSRVGRDWGQKRKLGMCGCGRGGGC